MLSERELEEIKMEMCDKYCKYPNQAPPEGKDEDWLLEDKESPCNSCPLLRL